MDFALVEIAAAAAEIAAVPAEMDSAEAERVGSVEMDFPGMDLPPEAVESEISAASQDQLKNSGYSDSAIQTGC